MTGAPLSAMAPIKAQRESDVFVVVNRLNGESLEWLVVRQHGEWRLSGSYEVWQSQGEADGRVAYLNRRLADGDSVPFHNGVFQPSPGQWHITDAGRWALARAAAILSGRDFATAKVTSGEWIMGGADVPA